VNRLAKFLAAYFFCLWMAAAAMSQEQSARPPITGVARVQVYVTDSGKSKEYYEQALGFAAETADCHKEFVVCLVVNNHQQIQLVQSPASVPANLIANVVFSTPDVGQMRRYLISKGLTPNPISDSPGHAQHFTLLDPEGHAVSFIQLPASKPVAKAPNQASTSLIHTGFIVHDRQAEDHFYKEILGFHLYWQGGMKDNETSWVSMQVPEGTDWIEYMLNIGPDANHHVIGIMNHIALGVADIQAAKQQLVKNGASLSEQPKLGRDGKWQLNLYDPDDTRVEFMEFKPVEKPCCSEYSGTHPAP
jgi:catechol 2,3-dioxygenase-like lactoylglutathione lyase family enzyme